jgi:hypothetical protein
VEGATLASSTEPDPTMNASRREFLEGMGLAVLALFLSGMLLFAGLVGLRNADYVRAVAFGVPGLIALYWSIRFARAQFATYDAQGSSEKRE